MKPAFGKWIAVVTLLVHSVMLSSAVAQNVDLSTVSRRDTVQLTIYNSADLTLVREVRHVTFQKGANPLQFSWVGTRIDPTSIELRFLEHADELSVVDATFPAARPQVVYWNVSSEHAGEVPVEISYFTSGISWAADYVCIANQAESHASLEGFIRISNQSGEEYDGASVRVVIGKINLVQAVAELAEAEGLKVEELREAKQVEKLSRLEATAGRAMLRKSGGMAPRDSKGASEEKEVVKEGVSEYFLFSIEGEETIPSGWSKRLRALQADKVPIRVQYRFRPQEYGEQLVKMFLLKNEVKGGLGTAPLPDGQMKIFADNGRDGLAFLTQYSMPYIPIGDNCELNLGADSNVKFELVKKSSARQKIWLQVGNSKQLRQIGGDNQIIKQENSRVVGWEDNSQFEQRITNLTGRPIDVEMRRTFPGDVVFRSGLGAQRFDFQTVQFSAQVKPTAKVSLPFELVQRQGTSAKQRQVEIVETAMEARK